MLVQPRGLEVVEKAPEGPHSRQVRAPREEQRLEAGGTLAYQASNERSLSFLLEFLIRAVLVYLHAVMCKLRVVL